MVISKNLYKKQKKLSGYTVTKAFLVLCYI